MNKRKIFKYKPYVHFDSRKNSKDYKVKISNRDWVSSHGFYPFIHYEIINPKKFKQSEPKKREIYYSAHLDRYIYQFYANELNTYYNKIAKEYGINRVSIAYRNIFNGKSNIHFAKEVIDFISVQEKAYVYIADFSKFFDRLDHSYLKEKLYDVLKCDKLPKEHYAIFKNITNFTYINRNDILEYKGINDKEYNKLDKIFETSKEFQSFKKKYLKKHRDSYEGKKNIGIPQGSSISAVYSNIYMIDFDKNINNYVTSNKGMYRRYCDDIIIVIPICDDEEYIKHTEKINAMRTSIPKLNVVINDNKTSKFIYSQGKVIGAKHTNKNLINYLGFSFDGNSVKIRDKSLFKYYKRMYRKATVSSKCSVVLNRKIFRKKLYGIYSHLGANPKHKKIRGVNNKHGNFLTYAYKAHDVFKENSKYKTNIRAQVKNHWKKMNIRLKEADLYYRNKYEK
ncbi:MULTISPECIES: reverse transcriptase domain-containing protein [unclassified Clostridioides]|uniref:reverse transcriptase domain-containing protein n=1 Tax=unclassified Clostridioides TaxID=2635829 RepID=UPI0038A1A3A9